VIVVRLILILTLIAVGVSLLMALVTRDKRYLRFAWQTLRFTVWLLLIFVLLFVLERYVLVGWRVLL